MTHEAPPQPGTSAGGFAVPRSDFISRNLGTGRPTIQCTACGEYSHWRKECPYDNFCTTCNNHDHATHMCRAPKDTPQQNPAMCVYYGSMEHSSVECHNRHIPPEATRDQEFQCTNSQISGKAGFQSTNNQRGASQPHAHRSYSEISGSTGSYQPNNHNPQFSRGTRTVAVDTQLGNKIVVITILVQVLGIMGTNQEDQQSPTLGLMRDTTNSTLHPYNH